MANFNDYLELRKSTNCFANYLGIQTTAIEKGYATGELKLRPEFYNSFGTVHGGVLFSVADTIGGSAAASYGKRMATLDATLNYLRPCKDVDTLFAVAREIKYGRTVCLFDVEVSDGNGRVFAKGTFSYFNFNEPLIKED
jgi:acyl-CoA thioesterase